MSSLYQKYRPQKWSEIVDQNHIKITIQNEIEEGKVSQAYLFCGPRAVGKTTTARIIAKAVNCENRKEGESEPCGKCDSCLSIERGNDLDVVEIDAASNTGVDNVRENIIAFSRLRPVHRKYKVFIIDEVHMLSLAAFNALLKILEEPPSYVIFILATTEIHKVPLTIISRCQRFDFKKIPINGIVEKLGKIAKKEGVEIEKNVLLEVAKRSQGCMRDAESLLAQVFSIGGKKITSEKAQLIIPQSDNNLCIELITYITKKDISKAINLINNIVSQGINLVVFTQNLLEIMRAILLIKIDSRFVSELAINFDDKTIENIGKLAKEIDKSKLLKIIDLLLEAKPNLVKSDITQLPLELAIAKACDFNDENIKSINYSNAMPMSNSSNSKKKINNKENSLQNSQEITIEEIKNKWNIFLKNVQGYNHSLIFILRLTKPISITGNQLKLSCQYKFHQERLKEPTIFNKLIKTLEQTYQKNLSLDIVVEEKHIENTKLDKKTQNNTEEDIIRDLEKEFAASIIE